MFKKSWLPFILLFWLIYITPLCSAGTFNAYSKETKSLFEIITKDKRFTKLTQEIEKHGLSSAFKEIKAGTVFAPINEAFGEDETQEIRTTREQILYHVVPIAVDSGKLDNGRLLETYAAKDSLPQFLKVTKTTIMRNVIIGTGVESNGAKVIDSNIEASNGYIHSIDHLLSFPLNLDDTLGQDEEIKDFHDLVDHAAIDGDLQNAKGYTIFATKESVFGDELSNIEKSYLSSREGRHDLARLLNHQISPKIFYTKDLKKGGSKIKTVEGSEDLDVLVDGSTITVNGVKVVKSDLLSSNGVIHVLEKPILPKEKDFIHLTARKVLSAVGANHFIKLLDSQRLSSYLDDKQDEPITILAPPNNALNEGSIPSSQVKTWLQYHIIHGRYHPSDLVNNQLLETESHQDLGESYHQRIRVTITEQDPNIYENSQIFIEKQSIQFGKSSVTEDPIEIGDNVIIYPVSNSLSLPRDTLSRLPTYLELSTFVATLYASEADETLEKAHGITLFAPTNEAFGHLGLLTKHLLQPESKDKLDQVARYHAVRDLFYENSTDQGEHQANTLVSGASIILNKTEDGFFVRGSGAIDGSDRSVIGKVIHKDIITASGVIHIIDRVQLPQTLKVNNRDLLSTEGTDKLLELIEYSNLTSEILEGDKAYTILAPSDRAFAKINLSHLKDDRERLLKFARLHIIPLKLPPFDAGEIKDRWWMESKEDMPGDIGYTGTEFPTLLSDDAKIVISKNVGGGYSVKVKGSSQDSTDIVDLGRSSSGGGVLKIDRVLVPPEEVQRGGLSWLQIVFIIMASLLGLSVLFFAIYYLWGWYQSRREGDLHLGGD